MISVINSRARGRPRAFDREQALRRAMQVFWAYGYEGASMPLLTAAMGISAQSLYAAYGSKESLYREALDLYRCTNGGFGNRAVAEEADAVDAMIRLMREAAAVFSDDPGTPGCMITTAPDHPANDPLVVMGRELRAEGVAMAAARLKQGQKEGQVLADIDTGAWARYIATVVQGLSVQARDGVTGEVLQEVVEVAVHALEMIRRGAKQGSSVGISSDNV